jgi:hypothetical protein
MILARFTVTDVGPIVDGQSDVELRSDDDDFYISFRRPASDNVMKGQEFILQSFEVAREVPVTKRDTSHIINLEPVNRLAQADSRKDLL